MKNGGSLGSLRGMQIISLLAWPFVMPYVTRLPGPGALNMPPSDASAGMD